MRKRSPRPAGMVLGSTVALAAGAYSLSEDRTTPDHALAEVGTAPPLGARSRPTGIAALGRLEAALVPTRHEHARPLRLNQGGG